MPSLSHHIRARQGSSLLGNINLGILQHERRNSAKTLLHALPCIQTRAVPSLFCLQSLCAQHGPPLSMDQQLCRILEPQDFHFAAFLLFRQPLFHFLVHVPGNFGHNPYNLCKIKTGISSCSQFFPSFSVCWSFFTCLLFDGDFDFFHSQIL